MGEREHVLETVYHCTIAGLLCTIAMCRKNIGGEEVTTRTRLRRKLDEEGGKEVLVVLWRDRDAECEFFEV